MKLTRRLFALSTLAVAALAAGHAHAQSGQTVKIAWLDPLSGMLANIGQNSLKTFQYMAEKVSADNPAGVKFEIVSFDNKLSPQESLTALKAATDQGIRYVTQGNGSSVAGALIDAINKHNARNPGKEIVFLNNAAVDPDFTNSKCSFWHFRFDADTSMKMEALTSYLKDEKNVKKVYLINQNYSHGHQVAKFFKEALARKRPDVQVVGEDLHPLAQVKDFAPYVAKIKASGADSIVTGNWGSDLSLLIKAAKDAGLDANWYTYYAGGAGGPTAIKQTGLDHKVFDVVEGNPNSAPPDAQKTEEEFRAKFNVTLWYPRAVNEMRMFQKAVTEAKSLDPKAVALKLEDMKVKTFDGGEGWMRKEDHQFHQDMYIRSFGALPKGAKFDEEKTGWGWTEVAKVAAKDTVVPTTCKMERP